MAEHLEKLKASPTESLNSRVTTVGVNGQKNDDAKQQKPVFLEEKDRLKELNLPKADEWIDAFVDGKLKALIDQSHINSTHRIMKVKLISCHNLRKSDTSPSITPFVTLISPDMDRFERQYKFTTFQTKKANSLNPIFNQTFYMPLYSGDVEASVAISKSGRPYNEKEKKRCGIQVHVQNYDEQMGDHESYGSCMLWFSEMDVSPQSLDECPKRISIPLAGPGAMEEDRW